MTVPPPIPCNWDGESFTPASPHLARLADKHFVVGMVYPLEVREERSGISHRHFFASVNEAWQNLPDGIADQFPSADHLRRWALIKAGYRDERSISCVSEEEARRVAAFVKPIDDYAVVVIVDCLVVVYTAKSQSVKAMPKGEFQRSKDAVLEIIAGLIGTTPNALDEAGRAA